MNTLQWLTKSFLTPQAPPARTLELEPHGGVGPTFRQGASLWASCRLGWKTPEGITSPPGQRQRRAISNQHSLDVGKTKGVYDSMKHARELELTSSPLIRVFSRQVSSPIICMHVSFFLSLYYFCIFALLPQPLVLCLKE